jgi:flagellar hook-associated protein 1
MTGFSTLNTAVSGLSAAQRAMDIVGQNVVNANTPGYSRQRVNTASVGSATSATFFTGNGTVFGGVSIENVTRIRDAFLESTRAAAGSRLEALRAQSDTLSGVEGLMSEPGDSGLQTVLDNFYASWQDLATRPGDASAGAVVLQNGAAVADQLEFVSQGVSARWTTARQSLGQVVNETNSTAQDLAALNQKIREGVVADHPANELLDQRDQLVRKLGELVGGVAVDGPDGMVGVSVGGVNLVDGSHAEQFTLTGAIDLSSAGSQPPTITWATGNVAVPVGSGKAAGLLSVLRTDLPNVSDQLDGVATSLRDLVNGVHNAGFTLAGAAGGDFFSGTDAKTLAVVPTDPSQLAVASASGVVDGATARRIGDLSDEAAASAALGAAGPSQRWRELATTLGVQTQSLNRTVTVQEAVVSTADDANEAIAGVNMDEEMTGMLAFQRAYQASARVITTVDEMMDTLINHTGTVGR